MVLCVALRMCLVHTTNIVVCEQRDVNDKREWLLDSPTNPNLTELNNLSFTSPNCRNMTNVTTLSFTLSALEGGLGKINNISGSPFVPLRYLNISVVRLFKNQLQRLAAGAFSGLEKATIIDLVTTNRSPSRPLFARFHTHCAVTLCQQGALTNLCLQGGNNLTQLEPQAFTGLHHLKTLFLSCAGSQNAPPTGSAGVQLVGFRCNNITSLEEGVFDGLVNLEDLNLSGNNMRSLASKVFEPLKALKNLYLDCAQSAFIMVNSQSEGKSQFSCNQLQELHDNTFVGLDSLQLLDLSGNALVKLQPGLFQPLQALTTLALQCRDNPVEPSQIQCNHLPELERGTFEGLSNLKSLDLSGVGLLKVCADLFADLESLVTLKLGCTLGCENGASSLAAEPRVLNCNRLAKLTHRTFTGLNKLQELNLNGNLLDEMYPRSFIETPALQMLDMSNNSMTTLYNETLDDMYLLQKPPLQLLHHLDLSGNQLKFIVQEVNDLVPFKLPNVTRLRLDSNPITLLPQGRAIPLKTQGSDGKCCRRFVEAPTTAAKIGFAQIQRQDVCIPFPLVCIRIHAVTYHLPCVAQPSRAPTTYRVLHQSTYHTAHHKPDLLVWQQ